jgi:hypothetical protein
MKANTESGTAPSATSTIPRIYNFSINVIM